MLVGGLVAACGGAKDSTVKNRVFFDWAEAGPGADRSAFERRYPPLDAPAAAALPRYDGYALLQGGVRISRPQDWRLRTASNQEDNAFVRYVSPNAYSFAVYQRPSSADDDWDEILDLFEADIEATGAKMSGPRVPMASFGAQGRAYTVRRQLEGPKTPIDSISREIVLRGDSQVVLVQIVFQGTDMSPLDDELLRVIRTLEVL